VGSGRRTLISKKLSKNAFWKGQKLGEAKVVLQGQKGQAVKKSVFLRRKKKKKVRRPVLSGLGRVGVKTIEWRKSSKKDPGGGWESDQVPRGPREKTRRHSEGVWTARLARAPTKEGKH